MLPPPTPTQMVPMRPGGYSRDPLPSIYNPAYVPPAPQTWQSDEARPHTAVIAMMWASLAVAIVTRKLLPLVNPVFGLAALGLSIFLVCSPNKVDKVNGWVVLGLNILGFVLAAVILMVVLGALVSSGGPHRLRGM